LDSNQCPNPKGPFKIKTAGKMSISIDRFKAFVIIALKDPRKRSDNDDSQSTTANPRIFLIRRVKNEPEYLEAFAL
jgi:hypothetical protein